MEPEPLLNSSKKMKLTALNFHKSIINDVLKDIPKDFTGVVEGFKIKIWMVNGKIHREGDLPAVIMYFMNFENRIGTVMYYENGKVHRKNGPAIFSPETINDPFNNSNLWFIHDKIITKTEHATFFAINKHLCNDVSFLIVSFASDYEDYFNTLSLSNVSSSSSSAEPRLVRN